MRESITTGLSDEELAYLMENGLAVGLSHPDDEARFISLISDAIKHRIPVYPFLMTLGQLGATFGEHRTEEETAAIRLPEFNDSMDALEIPPENRIILNFRDGYIPDSLEARTKVARELRRINSAIVAVDHPFQIAKIFDHPDHRRTGLIFADVAALLNSPGHYATAGESVPVNRPGLLLQVTDLSLNPDYALPLSKQMEKLRSQHLERWYPSQRSPNLTGWDDAFNDGMYRLSPIGFQVELYVRVR